jgi:hypothetical protein
MNSYHLNAELARQHHAALLNEARSERLAHDLGAATESTESRPGPLARFVQAALRRHSARPAIRSI